MARHAKRSAPKRFPIDLRENASADSSDGTGSAGPSAMGKMTMVYWRSKKFWLGKLLERPEIMTQGRTLGKLEKNIREAYLLMALDEVPKHYKVREVAML
jgi:hypothetical protein